MYTGYFSVLLAEMEAALERRRALATKMESQEKHLLQVAQSIDQLRSARKEIKTELKDTKKFLVSIETAIQELQLIVAHLNEREMRVEGEMAFARVRGKSRSGKGVTCVS